MTLQFSLTSTRRIAAITMVGLAAGLSACGGDDDTSGDAQSPTQTVTEAPAAELDKVVDTAATAKSASAETVSADELERQIDAIDTGLDDAGFEAINVGKVGDAKANFNIDTSWGVFVYESDRAAADYAVSMQDIYTEDSNYVMFRVGNRIYLTSMTSALSADDKTKLDQIAAAAEGSITS